MTRPPPSSTYDDDFYVWTREQAAALRRAGALGADIDIERVAEEIEDLGKRDLREVRSFLRLVLTHLLEIAASPNSTSVLHWRAEARTFSQSALDAFTPGMKRLLDVGVIWREATSKAGEDLRDAGVTLVAPTDCPLALDELLDDFDLDACLAKVEAVSWGVAAP